MTQVHIAFENKKAKKKLFNDKKFITAVEKMVTLITNNSNRVQPAFVIAPPITKHNLIFEVAEWKLGNDLGVNDDWLLFRVGTCEGQWRGIDKRFYEILSVKNSKPGNGHFDDVLEWFEHSCKRDGKALMIREIWNKRLYKHLLKKRGFKPYKKEDAIKTFKAV